MGTVYRRFEDKEEKKVSRLLAPFLWTFGCGKQEDALICGKLSDLDLKPFFFLLQTFTYRSIHV